MTESRMVWLAYWSIGDEDPPVFIGVASTEAGAWRLCEDTARLLPVHDGDGDQFVGLHHNEKDGYRWAWAEFASGKIVSWRSFLVEEIPFFDE